MKHNFENQITIKYWNAWMLTQEDRTNVELIKKKNMMKQKTTLPSLRNQDWKEFKLVIEKVNKELQLILTDNISELNELIYTGAKLVCHKMGIPLRNPNRNTKHE